MRVKLPITRHTHSEGGLAAIDYRLVAPTPINSHIWPQPRHVLSRDDISTHYDERLLRISLNQYAINYKSRSLSVPHIYNHGEQRLEGWPWDGFGFVHLQPKKSQSPTGQIRQDGFTYCSRLNLVQLETGNIVESHLPILLPDIPVFERDWTNIWKYLMKHGFNEQTSRATLIVGSDIEHPTGEKDAKAIGAEIAKVLAKSGIMLMQNIPIFDEQQGFLLSVDIGLQEIDKSHLSQTYQKTQTAWSQMITRIKEIITDVLDKSIPDKWQSWAALEVLEAIYKHLYPHANIDLGEFVGTPGPKRLEQIQLLAEDLASKSDEALLYINYKQIGCWLELLA